MVSVKTDSSTAVEPSFYASNQSANSFLHDAKYDFRPFTRLFPKDISTWVDQDESGDFDPSRVKHHNLIPLTKKRERHSNSNPDEVTFKKTKLNTWQLGRRVGLTRSITIKLKSDRGRALLQEIGVLANNWPEVQIPGEDEEKNFTELDSFSIQSQRLRDRQRFNQEFPSLTLHSSPQDSFPSLADVTLGHPAARGCKGCLEIGSICTLLQEGFTYPCFACREDDVECELVLPPVKKRACESCRRRRIVCSYRSDDQDHSSPCKQCENAGVKCIAGPLSGRTRTGPCLDRDLKAKNVFTPTFHRPFITCTQCRKAKKYCSLRSNRTGETCKRCAGLKQECTFEAVVNINRKRKAKLGNYIHSTPSQADTSPQTETLPQNSGTQPSLPPGFLVHNHSVSSTTRIIKTRLAHPIAFNSLVPEDGSSFCHWCNDISYGILGLGEVEVEVIDGNDGKEGYIEIGGGHMAQGRESSRMCPNCTTSRICIAFCPDHDLQPIQGIDYDNFDEMEVLKWLEPGLTSSTPFEWCSVCVKPASFACKNPNSMDSSPLEDESDEELGCGLRLCDGCAITLRFDLDGDLNNLIALLEADKDCGPLDIRADANFLHAEGHLLRRLA